MYIDLQYVNLLFADIAGKLSVMDLFIIVTWWFGSRWTRAWLTSHCPSVLWHCWFGHISLTRKIVSEYDIYCVEWDVKPYYTYTWWWKLHGPLIISFESNQYPRMTDRWTDSQTDTMPTAKSQSSVPECYKTLEWPLKVIQV